MQDYPKAFDEEHLHELLETNDSCATPARDEVERLVTLAEQRQDARTEPARDCLIANRLVWLRGRQFRVRQR